MGIDLAIIFGHGLGAEGVFELPERLSASPQVRAAAARAYATLKPRWGSLREPRWSWSPSIKSSAITGAWTQGEPADLEGVAGLSIYVGPRSAEGRHIERLAAFVADNDGIQLPLRRLCRSIANELGGSQVIYLPDSTYRISTVLDLVNEGLSIDAIISRLAEDFGPPTASIGAILVEDERSYEVDGYFIDHFCDLGDASPAPDLRSRVGR